MIRLCSTPIIVAALVLTGCAGGSSDSDSGSKPLVPFAAQNSNEASNESNNNTSTTTVVVNNGPGVMPEAIVNKLWIMNADSGETPEYLRYSPEGAKLQYLNTADNCYRQYVFGGVIPLTDNTYQLGSATWYANGTYSVAAIPDGEFGAGTEELVVTAGVLNRVVTTDDGFELLNEDYPESVGIAVTDLQICVPGS